MPSDGATRVTVDEALADYRANFPTAFLQNYLDVHTDRYRALARDVSHLAPSLEAGGQLRVLDIGPRFEVDLLHRLLPGATIDTIGLYPGPIAPRDGGRFTQLNLHEVIEPAQWPDIGPYRLIVMAEVIEHLNLPLSAVLPWLTSLLEPGGYLVVQTPNAVALPKRLRMLAGVHPFMPITPDPLHPGHVREYTMKELALAGRDAGLNVVEMVGANYFASRKRSNRVYQRLERIVPPTLRAGITVIYRKPPK